MDSGLLIIHHISKLRIHRTKITKLAFIWPTKTGIKSSWLWSLALLPTKKTEPLHRQKFKISKITIHTSANDRSIVVRRYLVFTVSERNNANFQRKNIKMIMRMAEILDFGIEPIRIIALK